MGVTASNPAAPSAVQESTGFYYGPLQRYSMGGGASKPLGKIRFVPIILRRSRLVDSLVVCKQTNSGGTALYGLYDDDNGKPGNLLWQRVGAPAAGTVLYSINQTLNAGVYWLASLFDTAQGTDMNYGVYEYFGGDEAGTYKYFEKAQANYATLPTPAGTVTPGGAVGEIPLMLLKA